MKALYRSGKFFQGIKIAILEFSTTGARGFPKFAKGVAETDCEFRTMGTGP
jgi:hypothetical protein